MCDDDVELSASRHKVKWSQDPRNVHWSSDTSKFGFRMLQKMGWTEGNGLGANEDGMKEHVKVSLKKDNLGVGASKCQSDEWIAQRESFESLLADLNGSSNNTNDTEGVVKDLAVTAKRSRKLTYRKMLKSKNLSMKSAEDMNCVLGKRKKNKDDDDQVVEKKSFQDDSGVPTVKSNISLNEYFSLRKKEVTEQKTDSDLDDLSKNYVVRKRKRNKDDDDQVVEEKSFQDDSGVPTVKSSISLNEYFSLRKKKVTEQKTDSDLDDSSKKKHRKKKKKTKST